MSNDDVLHQPDDDVGARQHSVVADVAFIPIANHETKKERPTSSRGNSFKVEKEKWSARGERLKDKFLTPPRSLSSRKSEEMHRDSDGSVSKRGSKDRGSLQGVLKSSKALGKRRSGNSTNSASKDLDQSRSVRSSVQQTASVASSSKSAASPNSQYLREREPRPAKVPSMDPAQLVQMALNLSESRKRHASNPVVMAPPVVVAPRQVSAELPASTKTLGMNGYLDQQPQQSYHLDAKPSNDLLVPDTDTDHYHFTPATLARAEKARRYFELADKHRRLLLQLPQLPRHSQGLRLRALSRASHRDEHDEFGRDYNPLQALRNRKLREQQKDYTMLSPEQFQDVDKVEQWLSQVESSSREHDLLRSSSLPSFSTDESISKGGHSHRRNGTVDTVIMRPNDEWSITPAELLADTYWLEQGQNKRLLGDNRKRKGHDTDTMQSNGDLAAQDNTQDATPEKVRHNHRHFIPLSAANRLRQHKFTRLNRSASVSSASSTEGRKRLPNDLNTGPLQRHMDEMIRKDADEQSSPPSTKSPDHWDPVHIRHRSIDYHSERSPQQNGHIHGRARKMNGHADMAKAAQSSPESSQPASPVADRLRPVTEDVSTQDKPRDLPSVRSKFPHLRPKSKDRNGLNTTENMFAPEGGPRDDGVGCAPSTQPTRPASFHRYKTGDSVSSSIRDLVHVRTKTDSSEKEPNSAVTRFLRGGKLGDMVRNESSRFGNKLRGRERNGDEAVSDMSALNSEASDNEGTTIPRAGASAEVSDASPRASLDRARGKTRYHIPHLPSFRSPQPRDATLQTIPSSDNNDHITRQQADLRRRNRSPRFERLAPPRINLPDEDGASQYLGIPADKSGTFDERRKSYGFLNPTLRGRSRSQSKSRPWLSRERTGPQARPTAQSTVSTAAADKSRNWSISDQRPPGIFSATSHVVTARDVARVRALLLASGIKAREISRRLEMPSTQTPSYLLETARISDMQASSLQRTSKRHEYKYAVDTLSKYVDDALAAFSHDIETFQTQNMQALITRQDCLKVRVSEDLTEMAHGASDQADAFNIELSTQATLRTKQVDDAVDAVLRLRRRQFRLLRQIAFKLLEWTTLSLLWWVWFVVVCFKTAQRIIFGIFRIVRWLLTF